MKGRRKCRACGAPAVVPPATRAELLAVLVRAQAALKREVAHPVPPKVQTYEQLERHELLHMHKQRGELEAIFEQVLEPEVARICWECGHKRRMAEIADLKT